MALTYQDVVRANGGVISWALVEAAGTDFAPWLDTTHLIGAGGHTYQQAGPFPTAFSLGFAIGASLQWPIGNLLFPPVTTEVWIKLSALAPVPYQLMIRAGATAVSGSGIYLDTLNHLHWTGFGAADIDTGFVWPDTNWHLLQWASGPGNALVLYFDGGTIFTGQSGTPSPAAPNTMGFLCDGSADNAHVAGFVSYPTLYLRMLSATEAFATFLAATDPTSAMAYTGTGGGQLGTVNAAVLEQILAAVRKTWPTT